MYLVFNMGHGFWHLSGPEDPVAFDVLNSGHLTMLGWVGRDSGIAFPALDRNSDGRIDSSELFGNMTPVPHGGVPANGFEALRQYDSNGDAVIDHRDAVWSSLLLWLDTNHDAVSQREELTSVAASTISAIGLSHRWLGRPDVSGNYFRYAGTVRIEGGVRGFYEISFASRSARP